MFTRIVIPNQAGPECEEAIFKIKNIVRRSKRGVIFMLLATPLCIFAPKIIPYANEEWMNNLAVVFVVVSIFRFVDIINHNRALEDLVALQNSSKIQEIDAN